MASTSSRSACKRLGIPFYKCPAFASLIFGTFSVAIIVLTQKYADLYLETEVALVTEISVAAALMFLLFLLVNRLQNNIEKKEQALQHQSEIEALRNEFTHIASRDIAEASTAMKWGIRTLEPSFESLSKQDQETLLHIRDRNDHILDIVRNLVLLSRIDRKEVVITKTQGNIAATIENVLSIMSRRTLAHGSHLAFIPPPETLLATTDHVVLADIIQSLYTYSLERTRGATDTITIRAFRTQHENGSGVKIIIADNAPPAPEYVQKDIFSRVIRNPHTGEMESASLGPHTAHLLADILNIELTISSSEEQTAFTMIVPL